MKLRDPYGFIYITTNLVNGKRYIGQKTLDGRGRWKSYLGSGAHLKASISKYGRIKFKRVIVAFAKDSDELNKMEFEYIRELNAVKSIHFYNQVDGGSPINSYNQKMAVACIDIATGQIFNSITEACGYANCSDTFIKSSFNKVHNYTFMEDPPIFRRIDGIVDISKMCCLCGEEFDTLITHNHKKVERCIDCDNRIGNQVKESKSTKAKIHRLDVKERKLLKCKDKLIKDKKKQKLINSYSDDISKAYKLGISCSNIMVMLDLPNINYTDIRNELSRLGVYQNKREKRYYAVKTKEGQIKGFQYLTQMLSWVDINLYRFNGADENVLGDINLSILKGAKWKGLEFLILDRQQYLNNVKK